jgi:lipoprotein-anchoring transpeptidase ErfK/SrfK
VIIMSIRVILPLLTGLLICGAASAGPLVLAPAANPAPVQQAAVQGPNLRGGFLEVLFGGFRAAVQPYYSTAPEPYGVEGSDPRNMDPRFLPQEVAYEGREAPGTIIINTPERMLYYVQGQGRAMRYGIGVGRPGFTWAGVHAVTSKREWPDWTPPDDMLKRRPDLPRHMEGGPENPLGARAMYLGSTLYRIHGSNEPWTIGTAVSSGCIRMRNEDVIDLYERVKVGTKVVVL